MWLMALYQRLVREVFLPLSLWRAGEISQLRYQREFERSQWLTAPELEALQLTRLKALVRHAYEQCPFYRARCHRGGLLPDDLARLEDLRAFPPLEKREIQENRDDMVARDWPRADLIPNHTGGSTGRPVPVFLSP